MPQSSRPTPAPPDAEKPRHHWIVRVTHWVNAVALTLMVASGLRIFNAYPAFARKGESFCCWPWEGHAAPAWLTFGRGLAGARNWHFAAMWVLAINGAIYLAFIWLHGEWRDLSPRRRDVRDAWEMIRFYLFVRKTHPHQGKHNALQKSVYFALPWLGVLAVLTGLAIWKPVQLAPLTGLFGGYVWARYWHFMVMMALVLLGAGHVFMVFAVDPQSLGSMVAGDYDESRSPEALNARPFLRRKPKPVLTLSSSAPSVPTAPPSVAPAVPTPPSPPAPAIPTRMVADLPRPVPPSSSEPPAMPATARNPSAEAVRDDPDREDDRSGEGAEDDQSGDRAGRSRDGSRDKRSIDGIGDERSGVGAKVDRSEDEAEGDQWGDGAAETRSGDGAADARGERGEDATRSAAMPDDREVGR